MSRLAYQARLSNKSLKSLTFASLTLVLSCGVSHQAMAACSGNVSTAGPDTVVCNAANPGAGENISTDGGDDKVTVTTGTVGTIDTGTENDQVIVNGGKTGSILTGAGDDSVAISVNNSSTGPINLGDGTNVISTANTVTVNNDGIVGGLGGITGGANVDTFNLTSGTIYGGLTATGFGAALRGQAGNDVFNISGGTYNGNVQGDDGDDTLNITGGTFNGAIQGNAGNDNITLSGATGATVNGAIAGGDGNDKITLRAGNVTGGITGNAGNDTILLQNYFNTTGTINAGTGGDLVIVGTNNPAENDTLRFRDINLAGTNASDPGGVGAQDRLFMFSGQSIGGEIQTSNVTGNSATTPYVLLFGGEVIGIERIGSSPRGSIEVNATSNGAVVVFDGGKLSGFAEFEIGGTNTSVYFRSGVIDTGPLTYSNGTSTLARESELSGSNNDGDTFIFDPVNSKDASKFYTLAMNAAATGNGGDSTASGGDLSVANLNKLLGIGANSDPSTTNANPNTAHQMIITTNEISLGNGNDTIRFVGAHTFGDDINLVFKSRDETTGAIVNEAPEFNGDTDDPAATGTAGTADLFEVTQGSRVGLGEISNFEILNVTTGSILSLELDPEITPPATTPAVPDIKFTTSITVDGTSVLQLTSEQEDETAVTVRTTNFALKSGSGLADFLTSQLPSYYAPFNTGGIFQIGALPGAEEEEENSSSTPEPEPGPISVTVRAPTGVTNALFQNEGTISMLNGVVGDEVEIKMDYAAGTTPSTFGHLVLETELGGSNSETDSLTVDDHKVSGTTVVYVKNVGGKGALTGDEGIVIVTVEEPSAPVDDDAFVLAVNKISGRQEVIAGPYSYRLFSEEVTDNGKPLVEFSLKSDVLDQVPAYTMAAAVAQRYAAGTVDTLYKRLGEVRLGHATDAERETSTGTVWVRGLYGDYDVDPAAGYAFSQRNDGVLAGTDFRAKDSYGGRWLLGVFGGYGTANADVSATIFNSISRSKVDLTAWTVGAYGTYYDNGKPGEGWHFDGILKADVFDFEMAAPNRAVKTSTDGYSGSVSGEFGYGFALGGNTVLQPQVQLAYTSVNQSSYRDSYDLDIGGKTSDSLIGRAGLQLQGNYGGPGSVFAPYVVASVLSEFLGDNPTTISGNSFKSDLSGTWYSVGGGLTAELSNSVALYGSGEYSFGDVQGWGGTGGVKVHW
jgi:outer membrane autotransporter protein